MYGASSPLQSLLQHDESERDSFAAASKSKAPGPRRARLAPSRDGVARLAPKRCARRLPAREYRRVLRMDVRRAGRFGICAASLRTLSSCAAFPRLRAPQLPLRPSDLRHQPSAQALSLFFFVRRISFAAALPRPAPLAGAAIVGGASRRARAAKRQRRRPARASALSKLPDYPNARMSVPGMFFRHGRATGHPFFMERGRTRRDARASPACRIVRMRPQY